MRAKFEGVPFHGTPPSQKHVGNTSSVTPSSSKSVLLNTFKQTAYRAAVGYVGKKALGMATSYLGIPHEISSIIPERVTRRVSNRALMVGRNAIINRREALRRMGW